MTLGEAFALRLGQLYLNFSPSTATQRAQQLAAFIRASARPADPEFGLTGNGTSILQSLSVAGVGVRSAQTAVVTLLATRNNQLMELGAARLATTYDMSVVDRQSGRWYVKDIRASTQPMGTQ